jgi:hypothetical protein
MTIPLATAAAAISLIALLAACGPSDDRQFRASGDTPRAAPATTPVQSVPVDSTTGVARSSGGPAVAGTRSSEIAAPTGKSADPKRPR